MGGREVRRGKENEEKGERIVPLPAAEGKRRGVAG